MKSHEKPPFSDGFPMVFHVRLLGVDADGGEVARIGWVLQPVAKNHGTQRHPNMDGFRKYYGIHLPMAPKMEIYPMINGESMGLCHC